MEISSQMYNIKNLFRFRATFSLIILFTLAMTRLGSADNTLEATTKAATTAATRPTLERGQPPKTKEVMC